MSSIKTTSETGVIKSRSERRKLKKTKQQKQVPSKVAVIKFLLKTEALAEMENKAILTVWNLKRKRELQEERRYD